MDARRGCIPLSSAVIAPSQWMVILILDTLVLLTIGVVRLDRKATAALGMAIFSDATCTVRTYLDSFFPRRAKRL
jgi:hypothetical protein